MRDDQLVCGACAGRVIDGRCPVCRSSAAALRQSRLSWPRLDWSRLSADSLLVPVLAALAALACLVAYYVRMA